MLMKYIGNILTDDRLESMELFNVTPEREALIDGIPTLIIGWERTKKEYPDASIIEWKVSDNVYWTYGKYEKRDKYEENLKKFNDIAISNLIESVLYVFYDILFYPEEKFESFLNLMKDGSKKTVYVSSNMMYVFMEKISPLTVIGLSIRDCDYLGLGNKKKLFSVLYSSENVNILKNGDEISREMRYKLKNRSYLTPYLLS